MKKCPVLPELNILQRLAFSHVGLLMIVFFLASTKSVVIKSDNWFDD